MYIPSRLCADQEHKGLMIKRNDNYLLKALSKMEKEYVMRDCV